MSYIKEVYQAANIYYKRGIYVGAILGILNTFMFLAIVGDTEVSPMHILPLLLLSFFLIKETVPKKDIK